MNWQLGLTRFIRRFPQTGDPPHTPVVWTLFHARPRRVEAPPARGFTAEREERLLPALIGALFDLEGSYGAWPPKRLTPLLELAGLDRVTGGMHLRGTNFPPSFRPGPPSRGLRQTVLQEGLAALDDGLLTETGATFDELSPLLRGYVLSAFERGELGFPREAAERFIDCLVETVTFAFLNFELELSPLAEEEAGDQWADKPAPPNRQSFLQTRSETIRS
jgi:hypothetical protein